MGGKKIPASSLAGFPTPSLNPAITKRRPAAKKRAGKSIGPHHFQPAGKRLGLTPSRRFLIVDSPSDDDDDDTESVTSTPKFMPQKRLPKVASKRFPKKTARKTNKHHAKFSYDDLESLLDDAMDAADLDDDDNDNDIDLHGLVVNNDNDSNDDDDDDNVLDALLVLIDFSFMNAAAARRKLVASQFDSGDDSSDSGDNSLLDLDVDFVKLQLQHKAKRYSPKKSQRPQLPRKYELAIALLDLELELSDVPSAELLTTSVEPPKFGRRKSDAVLPDDINFTFDFNDSTQNLALMPDGLDVGGGEVDEDLGEDLGEDLLTPDIPVLPQSLDMVDFDLAVPKITDANSDEEYEFDDNELLATLHADDDILDLPATLEPLRTRNNSIGSFGDDDEQKFLREEEKYLVNEFETNGFDDEVDELDEDMLEPELMDFGGDDYMPNPRDKITLRLKLALDEDDDLYMWNYFFATKLDEDEGEARAAAAAYDDAIVSLDDDNYGAGAGDGYESSDSTDVDENLPLTAADAHVGQKAKEVLSSTTTDYRPPVLGTWMTVDSKPFGIIDGLSTRTLNGHEQPRKSRKLVLAPAHVDDPLGLDELLNVSELDDLETDVKIWQDFNLRAKVPLGAFRNKLAGLATPVFTEGSKQKVYKRTARAKTAARKWARRRQLILEAIQEGYRPTKLGLFAEHILGDVEEVMGDDREFMNLIKGL